METFTVETFAPHVGEVFTIVGESEAPIGLELTAANDLSHQFNQASPTRGQFSIHFRGPAEWILPQKTYRMEFEPIGTFDIFLVPIGRDDAGTRYEAVFT